MVSTESARGEYKIPKSKVESYNAAEVFLKPTMTEIKKNEV